MNSSNESRLTKPGAADFDFLFGTWLVHHRKRKHRLAGETDWIQFEGEMICWPVLGGLGNGGANWEPNWTMIFKRQDPKK